MGKADARMRCRQARLSIGMIDMINAIGMAGPDAADSFTIVKLQHRITSLRGVKASMLPFPKVPFNEAATVPPKTYSTASH